MTDNDHPAEAEAPPTPKRRGGNRPGAGRPPNRNSYATLYRDLQRQQGFALLILAEAAATNDIELCHRIINIARKTLGEE